VRQSLRRASGGGAHSKEYAHGKGTILAALLGQFAVRLPYGARQIDQIFLFFSVFTSKNSQKPHK
jgi:hypothetical protein